MKIFITMRNTLILCTSFFMLIMNLSCSQNRKSDLAGEAIIPKPASVTSTGGYFKPDGNTVIYFQETDDVEKVSRYLADKLRPATGFGFEISKAEGTPDQGIFLSLGQVKNEGGEAYDLEITKKLLKLTASTSEGLFRGVQTVLQLFPAAIEKDTKQEVEWSIPTGSISDYPQYAYRGMMLDVARHFFEPEDVMRLIDQISLYKFNHLHLHLSDDQGWRIEIKSWPKLTETGGSTEVGGGKGGFFTQEDYTTIVNYAKDRYITIVPEIDMPGHTNAALASYPELNCNGKATELYTGTEVGFSSFCTKKDVTYKFIDDVVREISDLTPGPYFHIGGDESHSTKREDYIPFINKVQDIVTSHGKQVLGWDDIAIATLKPNTVAQHWASVENANLAVKQGAKILMSPSVKAYIDMQYDKDTKLGLHWAAYIEVDSAYKWDPASFTPGITKENIIGVEAPLWTETITNMDEMEYMVFPRLPGYAEIGWTASSQRNWDEYKFRLARHGERFKAKGIDFYESKVVPWNQTEKAEK
jgi:hexosaminidase